MDRGNSLPIAREMVFLMFQVIEQYHSGFQGTMIMWDEGQ